MSRRVPFKGMMPYITALVVAVVAASTTSSAIPDRFVAAGVQPFKSPDVAPSFTLTTVTGEPVSSTVLRGKVLLINFWATWCGPCKQEMPSLQRLQDLLGSDNFVLLAVTADPQREAIREFARTLGLSFPILLDERKEVSAAYGVRGLPTTVIVDHEGKLVGRAVGPREWDSGSAAALLRELLRRA